MAKQKLSDLSKDPELDFPFDKESDDQIPDFSFDFGADVNTKSNRKPITHIKQGAAEALSTGADSFVGGLKTKIEEKLPDAVKFTGEVGQMTSDLMYLGQEFQKDLAPSIQQLKRAGRALGPRIKQFLPDSLKKKYDALVAEEKDLAKQTQKMNKEQTENLAISSSLDAIFSKANLQQAKLAEEQFKEQKTDTLIDRALETKRHKDNFTQFHQIAIAANFQQRFIEQIQIPIMKKDLELKYRHFFVARDTLQEVKGLTKIVEEQLNQIRHNTALPDIQKQTKYESLKEERRQRISQMLNGYAVNFAKRVKEKFLEPVKEMISMAADAGELMTDTTSMQDEMEGVKGVGAQVGGLAGKFGGGWVGRKVAKMLFGESYAAGAQNLFGTQLLKANNLFKNLGTRLSLKAQKYAEEHEGTILGSFASLFGHSAGKGAGSVKNVQMKDPNAPATLTNKAVLSLTTIIPGYLAKAVKHLEQLVDGQQHEELIYDEQTNDFLRSSAVVGRTLQEIYGSKEQRNRDWGETTGRVQGLYNASVKKYGSHTGGSLKSFDEEQDDLRIFILNCGLTKNPLRMTAIKRYGGFTRKAVVEEPKDDWDVGLNFLDFVGNFGDSSTEDGDRTWVRETFKGVKSPASLMNVLSDMLLTPDGRVLEQNATLLENIIVDQMQKDGYLDKIQKLIMDKGLARHFKNTGIFRGSGSEFGIDTATFKKMSDSVDTTSDTFKNAKSTKVEYAEREATQLNSDFKLGDITSDPEFKEGIVGWGINQWRKFALANQELVDKAKALPGKARDKVLAEKDKFIIKLPPGVRNFYQKHAPDVLAKWEQLEKDLAKAKKENDKRLAEIGIGKDEYGGYFDKNLAVFDPYALAHHPDLANELGEEEGAMPSHPAKLRGGRRGGRQTVNASIKIPKKLTVALAEGQIVPTTVLNFEDLSKSLSDTLSTKLSGLEVKLAKDNEPAGNDAIISAITQFENTFKEYAASSVNAQKFLETIALGVGSMGTQMDKLIGNTSSTFMKIMRGTKSIITWPFSWAKKKGIEIHPLQRMGKIIGGAGRGLWWTTRKTYDGTKWGVGKFWDGSKWGYNKVLKPGITRAGQLAVDATGMGLAAVDWAGEKADNFLTDTVTGYGKLKERLANFKKWRQDKKEAIKKRVTGAWGRATGRFSRIRYVDVYLKDQIDENNPKLSAKDQQDGVYFVDSGNKVLTTWSINKPVKKPIKGANGEIVSWTTVITSDDIKTGLVDINNKPIGGFKGIIGKSFGLISKGGKKILDGVLGGMGFMGRFIKDMMEGKNPLANLMTNAMGMGLRGLGHLGGGLVKIGRRMFGLNEGLTSQGLYNVVGTRLDIIISILKYKFGISDKDIKYPSNVGDGETPPAVGGSQSSAEIQESTETKKKQEEKKSVEEKLLERAEPLLALPPGTGAIPLGPGQGDVAPGDADGDGRKDTIYEDRLNQEKEKKEKEETTLRHKFYKTILKLGNFFGGEGKDKKKGILGKLMDFLKNPLGAIMKLKDIGLGMLTTLLGVKTFVGGMFKGIFGLPGKLARLLAPLFSKMGLDLPGFRKGKKGKPGRVKRGKRFKMPKVGGWKTKLALSIGAGLGLDMLFSGDSSASELDESEEMERYATEERDPYLDPNNPDSPYYRPMIPGQQPSQFSQFSDKVHKAAQPDKNDTGMDINYNPEGPKANDFSIWKNIKNRFKENGFWGTALDAGLYAAGIIGTGGVGIAIAGLDILDDYAFGGRGKQNIFNYLGIMQDEFVEERCKIYGVPTDGWSIGNLFGGSILRQVIKLEEETYEIAIGKRGPLSRSELEDWTDRFGLDERDDNQVSYWFTWYKKRFMPCFKAYLEALQSRNYSFENSYDIPAEDRDYIINKMEVATGELVYSSKLSPTKDGWKAVEKSFRKTETGKKNAAKLEQREKDHGNYWSDLANPEKQKSEMEDVKRSQDKALKNAEQMNAAKNGAAINGVSKFVDMSNIDANGQPMSPDQIDAKFNQEFWGKDWTDPEFRRMLGADAGRGSGPGRNWQNEEAGPPPDMSGVNPANLKGKDGELGSYVRRFESGNKGTAAIAYDAPGGTSYGSYQFSSRRGSLKEFVQWLGNKSPRAYNALWPIIDKANTGSKTGMFVNAWLEQVKQGNITHALEHEYMKEKFYNVALDIIRRKNPELAQAIQGNRALQESLWSTAVQHGPYESGAPRVFLDHWKPGISIEDFLRSMYANRFTSRYFSELSRKDPAMLRSIANNRGKEELSIMLALAKQSPSDTTNQQTASADGGGSSLPATGGGDSGVQQSSAQVQQASYSPSLSQGGGAPSSGAPDSNSGTTVSPENTESRGEGDAIPKSGAQGAGGAIASGAPIDTSNILNPKQKDFKGLSPVLQQRFANLANEFYEKHGQKLLLSDGKRSYAQQERLFKTLPSGQAAAPSPIAPHISGLGLDAHSEQMHVADREGLLKKYGLWRPLWPKGLGSSPPEAWHIEPIGTRQSPNRRISKQEIVAMGGEWNDGNGNTQSFAGSAIASPSGSPDNMMAQGGGNQQTPSPQIQQASYTPSEDTTPQTQQASYSPSAVQESAPAPQDTTVGGGVGDAGGSSEINYTDKLDKMIQLLAAIMQLQSQLPKQLTTLIADMKSRGVHAGTFNGARNAKLQTA